MVRHAEKYNRRESKTLRVNIRIKIYFFFFFEIAHFLPSSSDCEVKFTPYRDEAYFRIAIYEILFVVLKQCETIREKRERRVLSFALLYR